MSPHDHSLPFKSQKPRKTFRWDRNASFPQRGRQLLPLCGNLQVYMNPSPPHISENRACHQIIYHVLKILCTMTGVFLKNKKIAILAWHYRPSNLGVPILLPCENVWLLVVSTRVTSKGQGSRSSIPLLLSNFLEPMKFSNNSQTYCHIQRCPIKYLVDKWEKW